MRCSGTFDFVTGEQYQDLTCLHCSHGSSHRPFPQRLVTLLIFTSPADLKTSWEVINIFTNMSRKNNRPFYPPLNKVERTFSLSKT